VIAINAIAAARYHQRVLVPACEGVVDGEGDG